MWLVRQRQRCSHSLGLVGSCAKRRRLLNDPRWPRQVPGPSAFTEAAERATIFPYSAILGVLMNTQLKRLLDVLLEIQQPAPDNVPAFLQALPDVGTLPSPWETWTLIG